MAAYMSAMRISQRSIGISSFSEGTRRRNDGSRSINRTNAACFDSAGTSAFAASSPSSRAGGGRRARRQEALMAKAANREKRATKRETPTTRVTKGEEFEVQHLTETTDLSPDQARGLLRKHGNDWRKLEEEAKTFKAES
jgi:hypothetical protein